MKGKTAISGLLAMGIVIGLATLGLVYGNWSQSLQIGGSITTSLLDASIEIKGIEDSDGSNNGLKDVGICRIGTAADGKHAEIIIENAYPNYSCDVFYSVENTGQMPIMVTPKNDGGVIHSSINVSLVCPGTQLLPGERLDCTATITFSKGAEELPQKALFDFGSKINITQFDKDPIPKTDQLIDADGIATNGVGVGTVKNGDVISFWPDNSNEGLDWFDNDGNGVWSDGDDLHLENPLGACSTGQRGGEHALGFDCAVLDLDKSLFDGQLVDCDLEFLLPAPVGGPSTTCPTLLGWIDSNGDGSYNNGEDIVLDVNNDGIFN